MTTVPFDPDGGPLHVEVASGYAQPGSYTLLLWESGQNALVGWPPDGATRPAGNFINDDDDRYRLPGAAAENDGRLVECIATIIVTPPLNSYDVSVTVYQDGRRLGGEARVGRGADFETVLADLFVLLVARTDAEE